VGDLASRIHWTQLLTAGMGASTIVRTAIAVPPHVLDQDSVKRVLSDVLPVPEARKVAVQVLFDQALVRTRHSIVPLERLPERRSLGQSMAMYREHAVRLGREVSERCLREADVPARAIDLVITVSCTGIMIPSLDAYLANDLGFRPDVKRLPITQLGCVAGASALSLAHDFLRGHPDAHVLVVAVELPTLSFQREDVSTAQLVSTTLFGDGAAAALLTGRPRPGSVAVVETESHLFPDTLDDLGFELRDDGFHVLLAKELPERLRDGLARVVDGLLARAGVPRRDLRSFVLHPGGRRILCALEEALAIERRFLQPSWDVLRDHGNVSSAAVLFVLDRWLRGPRPPAGEPGLLAAFGPGLTTELAVLRWT
jgi:alkylresorcinol/alkylpyrone synthase